MVDERGLCGCTDEEILNTSKPKWDDTSDVPTDLSTYWNPDTLRGPDPPPDWLVVADDAKDSDNGVLKTGKEADVSLVERSDGSRSCILAAKRYREDTHRAFRHDVAYRDGRRNRDSRSQRAMDRGTSKGKVMRAHAWARNEFEMMAAMWSAGVSVPYPVQLFGMELMLEYLGDEDHAAPRLVHADIDVDQATDLFDQAIVMLAPSPAPASSTATSRPTTCSYGATGSGRSTSPRLPTSTPTPPASTSCAATSTTSATLSPEPASRPPPTAPPSTTT